MRLNDVHMRETCAFVQTFCLRMLCPVVGALTKSKVADLARESVLF